MVANGGSSTGGGSVGNECDVVIVRGYTMVHGDAAVEKRAAIRTALHSLNSVSRPVAVDQLAICAPRAHASAQSRPLFRRIYYVPSSMSRCVGQAACMPPPSGPWVRLGLWAAIAAAALRVTGMQTTVSLNTQIACLVASSALLFVTCFRFLLSVKWGMLLNNVLASFDFWYVALNLAGAFVSQAVGSSLPPALLPIEYACHAVSFVSSVVGFLFLDAVDMDRADRAVRYVLLALLSLVDAIGWAFIHPNRERTADFYFLSTSFGGLVVSFLITVIAFMFKLCVESVNQRNRAPMQPLSPGSAIGLGDTYVARTTERPASPPPSDD